MTRTGSVYGQALYSLAQEESITGPVLEELTVLNHAFGENPDFIRLLSAPNLSRQERCCILEGSLRGKIHPYVLNFLKIVIEKGDMKHFDNCCEAFEAQYNQDNGILVVTAITAAELTPEQAEKLTGKLSRITGKKIRLRSKIDPTVLGGVRLDYGGKRLDDTVSHRLDAIRSLLNDTVL